MEKYLERHKDKLKDVFTEEEWLVFKSNNWRRLHGLPLVHKHRKKKYKLYTSKMHNVFSIIDNAMEGAVCASINNSIELMQPFTSRESDIIRCFTE